jgi:anionic cell wall polymer biosynthesis LytR-Cps2A-Psr (LCP) family protein
MTGKRRAGRGDQPSRPTPPPSAQPTPPPGSIIAQQPRMTRRQLRAERRRQRRQRLGIVGIISIVVVVLAVLAGIGFGVHKATSKSSAPEDRQQTALLTLQGPTGSALATMLIAHDNTAKQGLEMLVPSRLLIDVCGFGSEQFGNIIGLPQGPSIVKNTMSQILGGVAIDGTLTMTQGQLTKLVNTVGGVTVDVDVDVVQQQAGTGGVVLVPRGQQHLDGARAAEFATYVGSGEDPAASLARFQTVFQAVVAALPTKTSQAASVLSAAGISGDVTAAANLLVGVAADDRAKRLLPIDLPIQVIDAGGAQPSYRVDQPKTDQLVKAQLAASLPKATTTKKTTVLIENGAGTPGLVLAACNKLLPAGFGFAGSGNAPNFNYKTSQVIVFQATVAAAEIGDRIAGLLGLPQSDVVASAQGQNVADVVVILGHDYKP